MVTYNSSRDVGGRMVKVEDFKPQVEHHVKYIHVYVKRPT
jgi:hypothetical protein